MDVRLKRDRINMECMDIKRVKVSTEWNAWLQVIKSRPDVLFANAFDATKLHAYYSRSAQVRATAFGNICQSLTGILHM
jgi:hypothetical protein